MENTCELLYSFYVGLFLARVSPDNLKQTPLVQKWIRGVLFYGPLAVRAVRGFSFFTLREGQKRKPLFELLEVKQGFQQLPDNRTLAQNEIIIRRIPHTGEGTNPAPGRPNLLALPLGSNAMMWEC